MSDVTNTKTPEEIAAIKAENLKRIRKAAARIEKRKDSMIENEDYPDIIDKDNIKYYI